MRREAAASADHVLAARLPDLPRWVELRSALLRGDAEVHGTVDAPEPACVVRNATDGLLFVVGAPDAALVRRVAERARREQPAVELLAPWESRQALIAALPGWRATRAILHALASDERLPLPAPSASVRLLAAREVEALGDLPEGMAEELRSVARRTPIAAAFADGRPVSFCYAGAVTEGLWDISIDTLEGHRRRGLAAACVAHLVRRMRAQGRAPVWNALEENPASRRLAERLGFAAVDEQAVLTRSEG